MADNTKIEWCDRTFNPWIGCTKVSEGCQHCYAETLMDKRYGRVQWGPQGKRDRTSDANWKKPRQWNKQQWLECPSCQWRGDVSHTIVVVDGRLRCPACETETVPTRQRIFCASLADVFEDKPDQPELGDWRRQLLSLIYETPNLDWLLLTKRPENVMRMVSDSWQHEGLPSNIWIGTSVENQEQANKRIPELLEIPAAVRFSSMEPLLGYVDLTEIIYYPDEDDPDYAWHFDYAKEHDISVYEEIDSLTGACVDSVGDFGNFNGMAQGVGVDWVIVGGESGPYARPMNPEWVRSLRDQCQEAGVPFLFKQWGEWLPNAQEYGCYQPDANYNSRHMMVGDVAMVRVGKKAAGRLLDGRTWDEFPKMETAV